MEGNSRKSVIMALPFVNRQEMPFLHVSLCGTPPAVFGRYYVGSTKWRHNQIKRKQLAKRK